MNRFTWLLLLLPVGLLAQPVPDRAIPGWCQSGATKVQISGMSSSNTVQGAIPDCTVTVYLTGTTTKATIHSDSNNAPSSNPFTAGDSGQWVFWAQPATAYDIVLSGGRPGNTYTQPVTLTAVQVGGPGAGGATSPGGANQEVQFNAGGFFQGTTGLTWDSASSTLKYPSGSISANTINAATALTAGTITSGAITSSDAINGTSLTATSAVNGATVTASGAVSGATLNSTGNATVGGNLAVTGSMGAVNASSITATGTINGASVSAAGGSYQVAIPWDTGQPNIANNLVGCVGLNGMVHACPVNSPAWNGIQVAGGPGSASANSILAVGGQASCTFDGAATVGDYVQPSPSTQGFCHDSGSSTVPSNGRPVMGQVVAAGTPPLATVLITSVGGQSGTQGPAGPAGPAGPPGGSVSYPGVVSDNNNGLNVTGAITASSSQGYRQNNLVARSRNRDEVLQLTITPQDMPGCQQSGQGLIDDQPCFNAAINYLASTDSNVTRRLIIPYTQYGYTFRTPGYSQILPFDFGDYHGNAGYTTLAGVALQIANGTVNSCTFSGGSGYVASASLPVFIIDPSLKGSGAYATVQTNATGTPTGCTVVLAGMNYPSQGVQGYVVPLGGDGAAATVPMVGGSFTGQTVTVTAGGSGYSTVTPYSSTSLVAVGLQGITCTTYPTFTAVVTGTAITAVTVATGGSGCTGTSPATLSFGASCGGVQCTLLPPETPVAQPCGVQLINNLTIEGIGNPTIRGTVTLSGVQATLAGDMVLFCDTTGAQSANVTFKNLNFDNAFAGMYFPFEVQNLQTDNLGFGPNVGVPIYAYSFNGNYDKNFTATISSARSTTSTIRNTRAYTTTGILCGAAWIGRNPFQPGGWQSLLWANAWVGAFPVSTLPQYSHFNNGDGWGRCSNIRIENYVRVFNGTIPAATYNGIDQYIETNIWKAQDGPVTPVTFNATPIPYSNGTTLGCKTQIPGGILSAANRTVDYNFNISTSAINNYPYAQCFPGTSHSDFVFYPRYSQSDAGNLQSQVSIADVTSIQPVRPLVNGRFDNLTLNRISGISETIALSDVYFQTTQPAYKLINETSNFATPVVMAENLASGSGTITGVQIYVSGVSSTTGLYTRNVNGALTDTLPYLRLNKPELMVGTPTSITGCAIANCPGTGCPGGAGAGKIISGSTGTCVLIITPGLTAPNGYRCSATDLTTPTDILSQVTSTTTYCQIQGTTVSGDVITWQAIAF